MQYVAALSYGKDSLAMLEVIHRLGLPLDRIITVEEWATDNLRAVLPEIAEFEKAADGEIFKRYGKRVPAEVVHHIYPVDEYPEYAYEPWNLIALSRAAHNRLHDRNTEALTAEGVALMRRTRRV